MRGSAEFVYDINDGLDCACESAEYPQEEYQTVLQEKVSQRSLAWLLVTFTLEVQFMSAQ